MAFFWSLKIRLTNVIRSRRFKSFKGAEGACRTFVPWWIWTCSRRKGEERPSSGLPVPANPRAEQEEEGDDAEVDGMAVDGALGWIPEVEAFKHV